MVSAHEIINFVCLMWYNFCVPTLNLIIFSCRLDELVFFCFFLTLQNLDGKIKRLHCICTNCFCNKSRIMRGRHSKLDSSLLLWLDLWIVDRLQLIQIHLTDTGLVATQISSTVEGRALKLFCENSTEKNRSVASIARRYNAVLRGSNSRVVIASSKRCNSECRLCVAML
jgi:hypothetical protein